MAVILVVDDEELQRNIVKTILDDEGYETYTASSGEEALITVNKYNPDVILTDLRMEGMDGIELLRKIKTENPETEVIMITGYATLESAVEIAMRPASR